MNSTAAIIPARMASSRFPGKPLARICGLSMIEHVWRRALLCDDLDEVLIATCDREIAEEVARFGGKAVMTSDRHESCVDRVAEAAQNLDAQIIINLQGDVPLVQPESLKQLIVPFWEEKNLMFTDMMGPIEDASQLSNLNVVKVVCDKFNNALYYSRAPIPCTKKGIASSLSHRHKQFGINAYRGKAINTFANLPRTPLEKIESVDMIRLIENGFKVRMVSCTFPSIGVDTPEDLKLVEKYMAGDELFRVYGKESNKKVCKS